MPFSFIYAPLLEVFVLFAFFKTHNLPSYKLAFTFWDVVDSLTDCGFKVLALVADGATCNRKMFSLLNNGDASQKLCHQIVNVYDPDVPLFLLSDPSHLKPSATVYGQAGLMVHVL